ncbi:Angiopoietin-related protein 7 [Holothuria leucospilota]|uniref:Angiopoietin-related protein 7 n=1 Tax=Holothuria leucospilota TaxID=206669 RepID=A0A9Q1B9L2_HOLLE|nr:Angiopoietin-related protein 7 [Holothuria leucospilota]
MDNYRAIASLNFLQVLCNLAIITIVIVSPGNAQQGSRSDLTNDKNHGSFFFYRLPQYPQDCVSVRDECSLSNSSGVYLIKPEGCSEPFEVYCDNEDNLGGWTVVLRRLDDSLTFNRNWEEYKNGFGFLHTEFWLGNDKLAFLTNQAVYELRIDMVIANGTSLYASFGLFRISDEWSQYKLVLVGAYDGNITWSADLPCPPNMILGSCSCQPSCDDPTGVGSCQDNCDGQDEVCICSSGLLLKDGQCVLPSDCGCFETETDSVLLTGETHVNVGCTEKCTCESGRLVCDPNYRCSPNATCGVEDGVRQCYCNGGYGGDGETCAVVHKDCHDAYQDGNTEDGIYPILPTGWPGSPFNVVCDMTTAGGGWTLFQRRIDGVTDFYRDWDDYKHGFGSLQTGRDFWLGNEQLYYLTNQKDYKLRVDIVDSDSVPKYAEYTLFQIGFEYSKYRLNVGTYSGDAVLKYCLIVMSDGHLLSSRLVDLSFLPCITTQLEDKAVKGFRLEVPASTGLVMHAYIKACTFDPTKCVMQHLSRSTSTSCSPGSYTYVQEGILPGQFRVQFPPIPTQFPFHVPNSESGSPATFFVKGSPEYGYLGHQLPLFCCVSRYISLPIKPLCSFFFYRLPQYPQDCVSVRDECSLSNSSGAYLIKPDGLSDPFEVYCDNEDNLGGWTVILRRFDGSLTFNRNWEEYKNGFGFLHTEFWLGNDKIAFLTNQVVYELRIDMVIANGTSLYASFPLFRISDEWSQYKLVLVGAYDGNIMRNLYLSEQCLIKAWSANLPCPPNMILGSCSCQPSCDDPTGVGNCQDNCGGQDEVCICSSGLLLKDGQCVLPSDCGCFETETDSVLLAGETHVNVGCTEKCTCESDRLVCDPNYRCSPNATCGVEDGVRQCYCNDGYGGDGETCTVVHKDCYDAYQNGYTEDGIYPILPTGWPGSPFNVFCDMTTAGGGWTLFQRRIDGVTDFYRDWDDYKHGFGSLQTGGDFWLGNEQLYYLTNQKDYKLRVDIVTSDSLPKYAEYTSFQTGLEYSKYRLNIGTYSGNAGDGMEYGNGGAFSTRDEDNDACSHHDCAKEHRGAWWYNHPPSFCVECYYRSDFCNLFQTRISCNNRCTASNLNGNYNGATGETINWWYDNNCDLFSAEMKIRPTS